MKQRFYFNKEERLISRKAIDALFRERNFSVFQHPLKMSWLVYDHPSPSPVQLLISVPKRRFKKASSRNRIKRLLREVYRKNKPVLYEFLNSKDTRIIISIAYVGEKELSLQEVERIFLSIVEKFKAAYTAA
ncbi:MAG: ribonuclease P protein component [Bacteroidetes bacterium]|nr:MAG: ribonuclease P protein component [Bacteroidota bacterium]